MGAGAADVDPFAEDSAPPELVPTELTLANVTDALKAIHKKDGVERVVAILQSHGGGVQKMSALTPEFYAAVHAEATK